MSLILILLTACDRPLQTPIAKSQLQIELSATPTSTSTRTLTYPPIVTFVLPPTAIPIWTRTPTATSTFPLTSTSSYTPTLTNTQPLTRTFTPTRTYHSSITYTRTYTRTRTLPATITPTPTRTLAYPLPPQTFDVVKVSYSARYPFNNTLVVEVGQTVGLDITFEPVSLTVVYRSDGEILSVNTRPHPDIAIAQMRLCMELEDIFGVSCIHLKNTSR